ncbi:MAG: radical SAM protein [Bacteroidota bacterium]|nr:radical SAM protein [Bacteroidota bacterium]
MNGFLFDDVIFGPVRSRRLGLSLGINLLPADSKNCTFNCIYCECGWTTIQTDRKFPDRKLVAKYLEQKLQQMVKEDYLPDALTYAGNGEPTLHPEFAEIVDDTIVLRDKYVPNAKVSILSNASHIHDPKVFAALLKIDNNILKLDAGFEKTFRAINNPVVPLSFSQIIEDLKKFNGKLIIQSMFLRGKIGNNFIDNTTDSEVEEWIRHLKEIRPELVMIYPIARPTPLQNIEKIPIFELEKIAEKVKNAGLEPRVYP